MATSSDKLEKPSIVVAIGASAGGLAALRALFKKFDFAKSSAAFVITQHLAEKSQDMALNVLSQVTSWPVTPLQRSDVELKPRTIYLVPPHCLVEANEGRLMVHLAQSPTERHSVIDSMLQAIGHVYRQQSVAIILSGDASDGMRGITAVADEGGLTIAQLPETAQHPSMPQAAISTGFVDHALAPDAIPSKLHKYERFVAELTQDHHESELHRRIGQSLIKICDLLEKSTNHDFKHYKTSTLIRRIQRRMQVLQLSSIEEYVEKLASQPAESEALFKELLINVTSFFRDPEAFESLNQEVFEKVLPNRPLDQKFRIWVSGCSTGEEVYTLAILVKEQLEKLTNPPEVQIIATDIDEHALDIARKGSYPTSIENHVSAARLSKYFLRKAGRYHVTKELRELCLFSSHNLINDPPFSQLDLISCRNVLIYLGSHLQKKLIPVFHYALRAGGYLFLGTSESLSTHKELFRTISAKHRIAQRKSTAVRTTIPTTISTVFSPHLKELGTNHTNDIHLVSQRILLDEFSPKYAVVNEENQIVAVSAGINEFLNPSEGLFQNNIFKLVNSNLRIALRSALGDAKKHKRKIDYALPSTIKDDTGVRRVGIIVQPMPKLGEDTALFMVVFRDLGRVEDPKIIESETTASASVNAALVDQLERELAMVRGDLDKTVQDLEASNEELKSSNEELLSMNEELQSANEELEASKEEVQSSNDALQSSNSDLENLLASTHIATLFLDGDFRIRNFTPAINDIYRLTSNDVGRELHDFRSRVDMPAYPSARDLMGTERIAEHEIVMPDGRVFLRRISPYITHERAADGIVITFIDITELRRSEGRFYLLANSLPVMSWTAAPNGDIEYLNARWHEYTGQSEADYQKQGWLAAVHPDDKESVQHAWLVATDAGEDIAVEFRLKDVRGSYRWFEARGVPFRDARGTILQWFGTCADINSKRSEFDLLRESGETLRRIIETIPQLVWSADPEGHMDYVSERLVRYLGVARDEVLDTAWKKLLHPEDESHTVADWRRCREQGLAWSHDFRVLVRGNYRWVRALANPFFEDGRLTRYYGTWLDIQEQKLAALQIDSRIKNQQLMIRTSPSFMAVLRGPSYICEQANNQYLVLVGNRNIVGKPLFEVLTEVQNQGFRELLDKVRASGEPFVGREVPIMVQRKAGGEPERRFLDFVYQREGDTGDGEIRILVHGNDVTEKVLSKAAIENERENFRKLFKQTPEMVCILSGPEHLFEFVNEAHVQVLGFDATGKTVRQAQPESVEVHSILDNVYRTGITAELHEIPVTVGNRLRRFNLTYAPKWDVDGHIDGIMILGTEITSEYLIREELKTAKADAERASGAKTSFLANMSHEIRTPLTAVLGFTELLARAQGSDIDMHDMIERISRNAKQLGHLIDDLLDLSKIEANRLHIERVPIDLDSAIEDAFASVALQASEKSISFSIVKKRPLPKRAFTDPTRFRQILINLVGNAVKFTQKGSVKVELDVLPESLGQLLEVRVSDTGVGMTHQQAEQLFQPFSQGDASISRKFGGTGLGLALSRELARLLGGEVRLEHSAPDEGSVFVVTVATKLLDGEEATAVVPESNVGTVALEGRHVLVVDDLNDNRVLLSRYLKDMGATTEHASDGQEALSKTANGKFDAVLMDLQMPGLDGFSSFERLRQSGYRVPIVAVTAHAMKEERDRCLKAGFSGYITKPIDKNLLQQTLIKVLSN